MELQIEDRWKMKRNTTGHVARYGMLIALAFIFSYIEMLIPINLGIPGIKLGLDNLVVFIALYMEGWKGAFGISMVRIILVGFTFSNTFSMLYSLAGGILSFLVMLLCKKLKVFSKMGVSIAGGVSHNIGQITVAAFVVKNSGVFYYLPVLLVAGTITGALIGILGGLILNRLNRIM